MHTDDTIAAVSSAVGPAARMIVRLSGSRAIEIVQQHLSEPLIAQVSHVCLRVDKLQVPVWIYVFQEPRSVTGENVVELHLPGNPLIAQMVLTSLLAAGARHAEPGEFTARAYFNWKLDLSQAEGVAATIAAHSEAELSAARQLLAGELARRLKPIMEQIVQILSLVEAGIDFADEDIRFIADDDARARIDAIRTQLQELRDESSRFEPLTHSPRFVLVGKPNAGKSTLLNTLAGHQRAVVSPIAGTTRDVLSAEVVLRRGVIELVDVAGLEEALPQSSDDSPHAGIVREMHRQALAAVESADRVILVRDAADQRPDPPLPRIPDLIVHTKRDIAQSRNPAGLAISARTGEGLNELREAMDTLGFGSRSAGKLALNARHLHCIDECIAALQRAHNLVGHAGAELTAMELRESLDAAGKILGEVSPDDVLGRIFSTFCIGK